MSPAPLRERLVLSRLLRLTFDLGADPSRLPFLSHQVLPLPLLLLDPWQELTGPGLVGRPVSTTSSSGVGPTPLVAKADLYLSQPQRPLHQRLRYLHLCRRCQDRLVA